MIHSRFSLNRFVLTELFSNSFFVLYYEYVVLCEHLLLSKNKLLQIKLNSYKNLTTDKNLIRGKIAKYEMNTFII
jgi:hypothetical protein